ncbi:MAG: response regulator transcription factor [Oscillospiraceae bacterium]|jgi:DNA-binding response OmpR family regulator|nr:response regulator transcription factor [Oscillospiraceae bacterium]MBR3025901.1 response regulator transcription factor [Oscillospiraceae bacterium]MBR3535311.1 response regulator transcription factor [Oscillospiraceae bacterium]MBR6834455.1 response regulator transcription factor [Oscillospiraceae bacterium]
MKLLIAEDEKSLNDVITKKLTHEGFSVDSCFNGADALDRLLYADYDLAVLDIMMPEMSGTEVVTNLRREGKQTPVIFLTAKDTVNDRVTGLNLGASDYIVKPFSFDELIARIMAVMRTASGSVTNSVTLGGLTLHTDSHITELDGKEITLTGKEYDLLEFLMINKGRILSKAKILSHVWGYDYEGGDKIVEVYMNYLRKKIDSGRDEKLIHTVRGIGYVMKVEK